jgi:hypothetical protein
MLNINQNWNRWINFIKMQIKITFHKKAFNYSLAVASAGTARWTDEAILRGAAGYTNALKNLNLSYARVIIYFFFFMQCKNHYSI